MNVHRPPSRRGRMAASGNAQVITGSLWNAAVNTSTTASRSSGPAVRIASSGITATVARCVCVTT
jgi:hypothetical protein